MCSLPILIASGPSFLQDVHDSVFAPLHAQQRCRPAYLQAALCEYLASCHAHGLPPCPSLAALLVDVMLEQASWVAHHAWAACCALV